MPSIKIRQFPSRNLLLLFLFAFSCASKYNPVNVSNFTYNETKSVNDTLLVSYCYKVQEITNNKRYAVKEKRHKFITVALKINNVTSMPISLTPDNFKIYSSTGEIKLVSPATYTAKVKQRVGLHLLHALWGPWGISYQENGNGEGHVSGYYLPVGAIVGIGNAIRASNANKENKALMEGNEIWNKEIAPGKAIFGIVIIPLMETEALMFWYGKNPQQVH